MSRPRPPSDEGLTELQERTLAQLQSAGGTDLESLVQAFPEPRDAFVFSPAPLRMTDIVRLYCERQGAVVPPDYGRQLRARARDERWMEQRAVVQARRLAASREAVISAEATVFAMVGLHFTVNRVRSLLERHEMLEAYVMAQLTLCADGQASFTPFLRDACKELDALEERITETLPAPNLAERASEFWQSKGGDRQSMIRKIEERLSIADGGDRANHVFEVIEGGARAAGGSEPG